MAKAQLTPDEWQRTKEVLDSTGWNYAATARELGLARSTVQGRVISARAQKLTDEGLPLDGYRVKGTSTLYDSEGNITATWVKTATEAPTPEEAAAQVRLALEDFEPPTGNVEAPTSADADLVTLYPLSDWHVGLLSWAKETGYNYDLKIGKKVIETAVSRLIATAPNSSQGVVLGLGDLLHSDNYDSMTSRSSNILDSDGRYPKILYTATQLVLYTIDLALQKHESVLVRILPGNHDDQSAIAVTLAVSLYYKNNPRVIVDDDAGRFWWWSWGKVFLGATHGDKAKPKDLPLIMATRNPEAWGKAKFRHIHCGHIHNDKAIELNGVTVESHQSPVAPDAWHVGMGYGAGRSVRAITYHKDQGELMRHRVNIT
jgi:hypothetical protein